MRNEVLSTSKPLTFRFLLVFSSLCALANLASAQPRRITRPIDNAQRASFTGQISPRATAENDRGRVARSLKLDYVTLSLAQSASQQADLDQLLIDQQTPGSPNYHRWLTPEEYADRFGVSEDDLKQIVGWLEGQGLTIRGTAKGRNWIAVSGTAAQMESAFRTELRNYLVDNDVHFANATEPSVPAAIKPLVRGIHGLHDFRMKPSTRLGAGVVPNYTSGLGNHYLAPNDIATIYDLNPLYAAGMDGTGQKLVVVGQTQIDLTDIQFFRTRFGLPPNDPQTILVPNTKDPGITSGDLEEADLDIEWSGAVARGATIIYVYSFDVFDAVQYAIDQNLAPVMSMSYGSCELANLNSDALMIQALAQQGNAQGMTWFAASGDSGAADCNSSRNPGLAVDMPASIPEVTGVGGTEFSEGTGQYWAASNDGTGASVKSYIPEVAWNSSAIEGSPAATGGGASVYFVRPSWQTGPGVPNDNARHVPDVSLSASNHVDAYLVYTGGTLQAFGGTSVSAPAIAGMAAILNQYLVSNGMQASPGLGNVNPKLYSLAQTRPEAFHDITGGDNIVTVVCRLRICTSTSVGYPAGVGYDQVTGLGSVDAYNLITAWGGGGAIPPRPITSINLLSNLDSIMQNDVASFTATVVGVNGATPQGVVDFQIGSVSLGSVRLLGSAGIATATLSVPGSGLPSGTWTIVARFGGPAGPSASIGVTVVPTVRNISGATAILGFNNAASGTQQYAPGAYMAIAGSQLASTTQSAGSLPLPYSMGGFSATVNGVAAPLLWVFPTLVAIQIPYETPTGVPVVLTVNHDGQVASQSFNVSAAAPGIFVFNGSPIPNARAVQGQTVSLYMNGIGALSPAISTGGAPAAATALANLPKPLQTTTVSVGGLPARIDFIGEPWGLAGVTLINYQIPPAAPLGPQQVIVTTGGIASAPATVTVTN
jgi:uncharacterized protein (TIGR03437 family)